MDYNVSLDKEHSFVVLETWGPMKVEDFPSLVESVIALLRENVKIRKLIAFHEKSPTNSLSVDDIKALAQICAGYNDYLSGGKFAVVLDTIFDYGMGRMWATYTDHVLTFEVSVFRNSADAIEWLSL